MAGASRHAYDEWLEDQNDKRTAQLACKVGILKQVSLDIRHELSSQNRALDSMNVEFERTQGRMDKVNQTLRQLVTHSSGSCQLAIIFFFVIFFLSYWLI
jgi:hypothetical protein